MSVHTIAVAGRRGPRWLEQHGVAGHSAVIKPAALTADLGAFSLPVPPLFAALAPSRNILIAGAGGGFDVYVGLPLAFALRRGGARAHLASLSFSELELIGQEAWVAKHVAAVQPDTASPDWYFPERTLARWLAAQELPSTVYAFSPHGV
ncbi:hypothetical protein ABTX15_32100 [Micromonospora sp. NPDC094482]|uniref:hypothetical protein n=1 Tax=unclassified Micromonospora TaxID=2617518 RepID=UPI003318DC40